MTKKLIGLYQLITGVFGIAIIAISVFKDGAPSFPSPLYTQLFAGIVLFGLLAWTGNGLLNDKKNAVKYSRILQALQIVSFTITGTLYRFSAAAFIAVGIKDGGFTWGIAARPIAFAMATVPGNEFSFIIYIIPIILLVLLLKIK